jgi:uncharacterized protein YndB with AHSA1/START domain
MGYSETIISTPSDTEIRIERSFDAPRELVWEVYTDPQAMGEWLGPRDQKVTVDEMDLRPGGSYRWSAKMSDGTPIAFFGEYSVVDPPHVLEGTFSWDHSEAEPAVDRAEFQEADGGERTRLVVISTFATKEDRDGMLQSGMERGMNDGFDALDELLAARLGVSAGQ